MSYKPFTDSNNSHTQKLLDAYKLICVREGPSEMEIYAVSTQIVQQKCTSPWGCKYWDPKKAAFSKPIKTEESSSDLAKIKASEKDVKPQLLPKTEDSKNSIAFNYVREGTESQSSVKSEDVFSVLGKRSRETSATTDISKSFEIPCKVEVDEVSLNGVEMVGGNSIQAGLSTEAKEELPATEVIVEQRDDIQKGQSPAAVDNIIMPAAEQMHKQNDNREAHMENVVSLLAMVANGVDVSGLADSFLEELERSAKRKRLSTPEDN